MSLLVYYFLASTAQPWRLIPSSMTLCNPLSFTCEEWQELWEYVGWLQSSGLVGLSTTQKLHVGHPGKHEYASTPFGWLRRRCTSLSSRRQGFIHHPLLVHSLTLRYFQEGSSELFWISFPGHITQEQTIGAKITARTTFIVGELISKLHTHQYTNWIVEELVCVMRAYLWCLFVLPLWYHGKQLHNNNARGVSIQLHAHQLHNNKHWAISCVIISAPMVFRETWTFTASPIESSCWSCSQLACVALATIKVQERIVEHPQVQVVEKTVEVPQVPPT